MICSHIIFHIPSSSCSGSLVTAIKQKAKYIFCVAAVSVYILQRKGVEWA